MDCASFSQVVFLICVMFLDFNRLNFANFPLNINTNSISYSITNNTNLLYGSTTELFADHPIFFEKQCELTSFPRFVMETAKVISRYDYPFTYQKTINHPFTGSKTMYNPLVYMGTDLKPFVVYVKLTSILSEEYSIYQLDNGFVSDDYWIGTPENQLIDIWIPHYNIADLENAPKREKIPTYKGFKYVLFVPHSYSYLFGHYFCDGIMGYMNVPQWIWDLNPVIVHNNFHDLLHEHLKVFGHENVTIIAPKHKFVYGEHVFICANRDCHNSYGIHSYPILRDKLYRYYNLYSIQPVKYGYMNKRYGQRHFRNLDIVMRSISEKKGIVFEKHTVNKPTMVDFYRILASMRLFICPCGSIAFNAPFIHEGMGFITLNADGIDGPNLKVLRDLHLWGISLLHPQMKHYGRSGDANEAKISVCIDIILYAIENHKWPPNHHLLPGFDYKPIIEWVKRNSSILSCDMMYPIIAEYAKTVDLNAMQI